jgi:hypothetical protein
MTNLPSQTKVESAQQTGDTNARITLTGLILGSIIALTLLTALFAGKKTDFEDAAAMGAQTTSLFATVGQHRIHCQDSRDAAECIAGVKARGASHSVLWLGNSQLHAVNQWQHGETNSTPLLFGLLKQHTLDLVTFSEPNANLQEHYVLFEYLRRKLPLNTLLLPVCFDDTRNEGLRPDVHLLIDNTEVTTALTKTVIGKQLLNAPKEITEDQETAGISHTIQQRVENSINDWLFTHSALWRARPQIRGEFFAQLYNLRNTVFHIKATAKRKLIRAQYHDNLTALEAILDSAAKNHINVLVYIPPIRNDVEIPYVTSEYDQFKKDVTVLTAQYGATYANLENLVPAELWGSKDSTTVSGGAELDFMHFQAGGHKLLAAELDRLVSQSFIGKREKR